MSHWQEDFVSILKAITELIKAFFAGFGVIEALVLIVVLALVVAIFRPEALAASLEWLINILPAIRGDVSATVS